MERPCLSGGQALTRHRKRVCELHRSAHRSSPRSQTLQDSIRSELRLRATNAFRHQAPQGLGIAVCGQLLLAVDRRAVRARETEPGVFRIEVFTPPMGHDLTDPELADMALFRGRWHTACSW